MLETAVGIFAIAALGGAYVASRVFTNKPIPWAATVLHGVFAATGLVLLLLGVMNTSAPAMARWALIGFLVAALGGFFLVSFHLRGKTHPKPVVLIHAGVAVASFLLLLSVVL